MKDKIDAFLELVQERNGHEPEFLQAVKEVAETVIPLYRKARYLSWEEYFIENG